MEGLDYLGADEIGHGGGSHGGRGFRGGGWGWGGPAVIIEEQPFSAFIDEDGEVFLLGGDSKIATAQAALKAAGFDPKGADGIMGPNTAAAITAFWASKGVSHAPVVDDDLMNALGSKPAASPSDGRPAKGWSQPQPDKMGPAVTPESEDALAEKKKWYVVIGGAAAVAIGVLLFAFGGGR